MSTKLHDIPTNAILGAGLTPRTATASLNGTGADFISGEGRCTAIQTVGTVGGTSPTLAGKIQESADNASWTDIAGATFTTVTTSDNVQAISFDRTKRHLRYVATIAGTSPSFPVAVVITQQKKQV
jgi:hypothetical protein